MRIESDEARILTEDERAIWGCLYKGEGYAITAGRIAMLTGIGDKTGAPVRGVIEDALERFPEPVAACSRGYFVVQTQEEVDTYLGDLANRAIKIFLRRKAFKRKAGEHGFRTTDNVPEQDAWEELREMARNTNAGVTG